MDPFFAPRENTSECRNFEVILKKMMRWCCAGLRCALRCACAALCCAAGNAWRPDQSRRPHIQLNGGKTSSIWLKISYAKSAFCVKNRVSSSMFCPEPPALSCWSKPSLFTMIRTKLQKTSCCFFLRDTSLRWGRGMSSPCPSLPLACACIHTTSTMRLLVDSCYR